MALKKTVISKFGMEISNAYHRIVNVNIRQDKTAIATVNSYVTGSVEELPFDSKSFSFNFNIDGNNIYSQCYEHLKSTTDFSNSRDC
jgi:hypothetical protein